MKQCTNCGLEKPLSEFQKRAKSADGHAASCKPCKRAYDNAHYKSHPQRKLDIKHSDDKRLRANRAWIRQYLIENPCVDCGEADIVVLEFDHLDDKVANVSNMLRYNSLERIKLEVAKCVVRCANCHKRKTAKDFNWWKYAPVV